MLKTVPRIYELTHTTKAGQHFVWRWLEGKENRVLSAIGSAASDFDLPFSWYDAASVASKVHAIIDTAAIADAEGSE